MSRLSMLSAPFMLGFDSFEERIERLTKSADGYPPYNIERLTSNNDAGETSVEMYQITIAVAGFSRQDLQITSEDTQLHVFGNQSRDEGGEFLHRGIATRQFKRSFLLADGMVVKGATLSDGMLSIDVERPVFAKVSRTIEIVQGDGV